MTFQTLAFPDAVDLLLVNGHVASMADPSLSLIEYGAVAVNGPSIAWVGRDKDLPRGYESRCRTLMDCNGQWILPGFVDCHTHLIWAGSRSREFELRLQGSSYEDIARSGGGIQSTVRATRKASSDELFHLASNRIEMMMNHGVTTLEIKSGYGLDLETELRLLEVASRLGKAFALHIEPTFLGAHALPPEFAGDRDAYIDLVTQVMLPAVRDQGIATAVDVFCERIAFSRDQTGKVFKAARDLGLHIKLHAEQLSNSNGAALAAQMGALSCDHLEYLSLSGAKRMARHGTVAVMLPGAFYYLGQTRKPPIRTFRDLGIPMAVSTDLNPGSSPVFAMPPALNMACVLFGLTCEEALLGATLNAAAALGLDGIKGSIEPGKDADLVFWDIDHPRDLCYAMGHGPAEKVMIKGDISSYQIKLSKNQNLI